MANPKGDIIDRPIKANFREGLTVLEYFISTHGARKGLADTALRTADSGYLTRRLVDVAQDVIVRETDCGTDEGVAFRDPQGRRATSTTTSSAAACSSRRSTPKTGEIVRRGRLLHRATTTSSQSSSTRVSSHVDGRTVMTCHAKHGICQACYGWDLASSRPVDIGTAVGIIAAQSIGEPGTQLTMRTFHTGGVAGEDITHGLPRVTELFEARKPKGQAHPRRGRRQADHRGRRQDPQAHHHRRRWPREGVHGLASRAPASRVSSTVPTIELGQQLTEGSVNPHDLLAPQGSERDAALHRRAGPGRLPLAGRRHQRQAHRGHRRQMLRKVSVTEPGDTDFLPGQLVDRLDFAAANETRHRRRRRARQRPPGPARHHQGLAGDGQLPLGGLLPGDDARAHRRRDRRQGRRPARPQGERHHR